MKRAYLLLVCLLVVGALALLGLAIAEHKGYVLFAYQGLRYESTLWAFVVLIVALWLLIYLLRLLLRAVLTSAGLVNPWSRLHRRRRVRHASEHGFLELAEGRWSKALAHLRRAARSEPQPLMHYLGAARAANQLEQYEDSDALLAEALERQPNAELAIALTHAELQLARGQVDTALQTLQVMHERYPRHPLVLRQLQQLYLLRGDWPALLGLLPELRKEKALGTAELDELERQAWRGRLASIDGVAGDTGSTLASLAQTWERLSSSLRHEPELLAVYAERLRMLGAEPGAEELLHKALSRQYDSRLVRLYGLLRGRDPARQLQAAEGWLKQHPEDAGLLLTLGRLCLHNQLWGKAREYFESSLAFERHPETCAELARLLAQLGEVERSNQLFQEGLGLLDRRLSGQALPAPLAV
ncbi:heme biosynthesis HemY N-terminal domain-containing protein [Phytopseudomonas dryadis]|uniref:Heme biosynthesis protein HemY n=1 Tax=Phytopseudomonas dryadis TaxID=2487520 RepID=A0A4Q9RAK3_9GAMM|nr:MULTISPECIES: heme biosynthesis HemY N-terminal domain-containing protein [Pseudomonas]TBU97015.1 heme biosynthesis protein HemY [Pseudomonas dryadis]TBV08646.1 heme biosynthesis protein HemY [Pseudomonas dryadis]TBV13918.1 heme biosynthesis protein HemY [Pseudomonas sp. FRB 230]